MNYCTECGAEVEGSEAYCPKCGTELEATQPPPPQEVPPNGDTEEDKKANSILQNERFAWVVGIILFVLIGASLVFGGVGGETESSDGGAGPTPFQEIANNDAGLDTRADAVEAADRALEFHDIETTEKNRERLAELALEAAEQDPNQTAGNILLCVWSEPLSGDENLSSWQQVENLAAACA
jgi:hypothetical protein